MVDEGGGGGGGKGASTTDKSVGCGKGTTLHTRDYKRFVTKFIRIAFKVRNDLRAKTKGAVLYIILSILYNI